MVWRLWKLYFEEKENVYVVLGLRVPFMIEKNFYLINRGRNLVPHTTQHYQKNFEFREGVFLGLV